MNWTRGKTIGYGSTATVSVATCNNSGETFAVKSVELHNSEFLQREAKILYSLNSPYVIRYKGSEVSDRTYNLLMEYAPYGTLTENCKKVHHDERKIAKYTRQILLGLEYIHSKGIVHCDIKGSNVLVGENGEAKICDFGCSKSELTEGVKGTPAFMAPEVARGERQGKESDIWALGCTVIEMFTGSPPWIGLDPVPDPVSILYRVGYLGEIPTFPCSISEQGKDFLGKCFGKERCTASELLNHPFLVLGKDPEVETGLVNYSPTSVMDQMLWRSVEEDDQTSLWECHKERWTASELLNHPFLVSSKDPELETGLVNYSPTSVMDQMLWRSVEEDDQTSLWECHKERIGVLSWRGQIVVVETTWDMDGEDWILVRGE